MPLHGTLLSDYWYIRLLPGFRTNPDRLEASPGLRITTVHQAAVTPDIVEGWDYLVPSDLIPPDAEAALQGMVAAGTVEIIDTFESEPFMAHGVPVEFRMMRVAER